MATEMNHPGNESIPASSGVGVGLARVFWTLFGPMILFGILLLNFSQPGGWLTRWDVLVPVIVAALIGCRWLEQLTPGARTAYGDSSTPAHFRRYVLVLVTATVAAWVLVNILANHVLS